MTLVLTVVRSEPGLPDDLSPLRLDRHGALIGRSAHADWTLPDPQNHVSSSHCDISYRDGGYELTDRSTNGTFVNGSAERLQGARRLVDDDHIVIGPYEIRVSFETASTNTGSSGLDPAPSLAQPEPAAWRDWTFDAPSPSAPVEPRMAPAAAISGRGPLSDHWSAPAIAPVAAPVAAPTLPANKAGSAAGEDLWSKLARDHQVDWGSPPASFDTAAADAPQTLIDAPAYGPDNTLLAAFLRGARLTQAPPSADPVELLEAAGAALHHLVSGLIPLVEARSRAKAQMGAQGTALELEGNNPLKFVRAADRALALLLEPPSVGYMGADRAIQDAYHDLQAHQMATLMAMQGALAQTLERFSPQALRDQAGSPTLVQRAAPHLRDACLWRRYESAFEGVARGSDEAFMEVFAREFRRAYETLAHDLRTKSAP